MPVEIRELIIRAVATPAAHAAAEPEEAAPPSADAAAERAALIQECVRQVLRILQQRKAR